MPEVTAQLSAAFNAVREIVAAVEARQDALSLTPMGRQWIADAEAMRQLADDD
jgi:hypothetical protein